MANFDLSQYATVQERVVQFWAIYPNGRLETELVFHSDTSYIVKASAYKDMNDPFPSATDYAQETVGASMTTKNFPLETCSTSSLGRCLATLNISTRKNEQKSSREDMQRVIDKGEQPIITSGGPMARAKATEKQIGFAISMLKEIAQRLEFSYEDVMKWACEEYKCKTLEDFSMKQISHFIADLQKTKQQGESSVFYNLVRAKKGPDYDPWATPSN
jgi:hypothetical protein